MKDVNNDDTVAEASLEERHEFIEKFVIGGMYLFKIKEQHSLYSQFFLNTHCRVQSTLVTLALRKKEEVELVPLANVFW